MRNRKMSRSDGYCYTVQAGDTIESIASANHVTVSAILAANPRLKKHRILFVGQTIWIPENNEE